MELIVDAFKLITKSKSSNAQNLIQNKVDLILPGQRETNDLLA